MLTPILAVIVRDLRLALRRQPGQLPVLQLLPQVLKPVYLQHLFLLLQPHTDYH